MIKLYYMLTKPGIVLGNIITTLSGFLLASRGHVDWMLLFVTVMGIALIMGSACVCNNYIDRNCDRKMARTKNRPLASGAISPQRALTFAIFLLAVGSWILGAYTNALTLMIALIGFVTYVVLYSLWKYRSVYGTLIGSIAGAVPPLIGYCAVSNRFDLGAGLLFTLLVLWQMPHFYAIALYRIHDYLSAAIPVLPIQRGAYVTKVHMLCYILAYTLVISLFTFLGYVGYSFLVVSSIVSLGWLWLSVAGFKARNDIVWARSMFRWSLVVVMTCSVMICVNGLGWN